MVGTLEWVWIYGVFYISSLGSTSCCNNYLSPMDRARSSLSGSLLARKDDLPVCFLVKNEQVRSQSQMCEGDT
jgi:hypothetical protein